MQYIINTYMHNLKLYIIYYNLCYVSKTVYWKHAILFEIIR